MKVMLLNLLLIFSLNAFAQVADEDCDTTPQIVKDLNKAIQQTSGVAGCPNKSKLMNVCSMIDRRSEDPNPIGYHQYLYYRKILEASCVDLKKDSEKVIQEKVQKAWNDLSGDMVCNSTIFDVTNGNYLKYAVNSKFDEFIDDAIEWKVNLNVVDKSDGKTVLDYIKHQMDKNKGNTIERKMRYYYDTLRAAGAKHKSEL